MSTRRGILNKEPVEYNIVILGANGVGKSAIAVRYLTRRFITEYAVTLETITSKLQTIENHSIQLKVMDTYDKVSEENKDSIINPERYTKWANAAIVVYSITNRSSFDRARIYLESFSPQQIKVIALVGNKSDLERYRTVSRAAGEGLSNDFDCLFFEVAAAEDYANVKQVFLDVIRELARSEVNLPLQQLFISEDTRSGLLAQHGISRRRQRYKPAKDGAKLRGDPGANGAKLRGDSGANGAKLRGEPGAKRAVNSIKSVMNKKFNLFN